MSRARSAVSVISDVAMTVGLVGALIGVGVYEAGAVRPTTTEEVVADAVADADPSRSPSPGPAEPRVRKAARGAPAAAASEPDPSLPIIENAQRTERVEVKRKLKFAVIDPPNFDDVAQLLEGMGEGYRDFERVGWDELLDPERRKDYDVVFLTCGAPKDVKGPGTPKIVEMLKDFAESGKTLYVSDLWYPALVAAFPEALDSSAEGKSPAEAAQVLKDRRYREAYGKEQQIDAEVRDASLRAMLGDKLRLPFDASGWAPAIFNGERVTTMLAGRYETVTGLTRVEPLLVKFPAGRGTVIFTSFHNSKLLNDSGRKLLTCLVVAVATSHVERQIMETAVRGGLSPRHGGLLRASHGGEPVRLTYDHRRRGRLKFILGFETGAGAELKLTVQGPSGPPISKQGTAGVEIELPDADEGEWSYTISTIRVPYDDFGYRLLIAE